MRKFSSIMRVNSRRTSRNKRNRRLSQILLLGLVCLIAIVVIPVILSVLSALIVSPVVKTKAWLYESSGSFPQFFRDRQELLAEIKELETRLSSQSGDRFTVDALIDENEELRSLLGYEGEERVLASVIGRPPHLPYDVLMLDRGSEQGVVLDAPVFIGDSTIIGVVRKVYRNSSIVELVTSPDFSTTVYIIGPDIFTTAKGVGGGQLKLGVPQGIELTVGDLVVIPAVSSGVFGTINYVESLPTRPEQYAYVSTEIPLHSLRLVSVGKNPVTPIEFEEAEQIIREQSRRALEVPVPEGALIDLGSASSTATSTATTTVSSTTTDSDVTESVSEQ